MEGINEASPLITPLKRLGLRSKKLVPATTPYSKTANNNDTLKTPQSEMASLSKITQSAPVVQSVFSPANKFGSVFEIELMTPEQLSTIRRRPSFNNRLRRTVTKKRIDFQKTDSPEKDSKSDPLENFTYDEEIRRLEESLRLKEREIISHLHYTTQCQKLRESIALWTSACQEAITDLASNLNEDLDSVIGALNISHQLIQYEPEKQGFSDL